MIKIVISLFLVFAVSRVYLRYRDGSLSLPAMLGWLTIWLGVGVVSWWPRLTEGVALRLGVGRGADVLIYLAILALFYGLFRLYIKIDNLERDLTTLVRQLALRRHRRDGTGR